MSNITVDTPHYRKVNAHKLSLEYSQAFFSLIVSLILTIIFLINGFDFSSTSIKPFFFSAFVAYLFSTILQMLITWRIKQNLKKFGNIQQATRKWGYIQLISLLFGNVFTASSALLLIKEKKSIDYIFAVYMLLAQFLVIAVSSLNLFKPYVADTFLLGMYILVGISLFYLYIFYLLPKINKDSLSPTKVILLSIALFLTGLTGNLFAILLGINLLHRIKKDKQSGKNAWSTTWKKISNNFSAMLGLFFIIFLFTLSICSYLTFDRDLAIENNYSAILQTPSLTYPLGTDDFGRDLLSRIIFGARISLIVGFLSTIIPLFIGGFLGALAGYYGNRADNMIMRLLDVLYAIPGILLAIVIIAAFGSNTITLIIALSVGSIPTYARTMRANILMISNLEYIESAKALGANNFTILFKHAVPNSLAPMIVKSTLTIGSAVIATSSLSYLGLGVEPHIPEWGNILKIGSAYLESHSYLAIYPGLCIIALVLSFNFLGDGLRDALDPKLD
ncbi:ABC transporter permease [Bacillales bacterium AN1005]|uniref:ABC transporter permease n=1 Tax=Niallia taxi TaxID=2499688 RepID=UPI00300BBE9A